MLSMRCGANDRLRQRKHVRFLIRRIRREGAPALMIILAGMAVNSLVLKTSAQAPAPAAAPPPRLGTEFGISAFERECTKCHGNAAVDRAPSPAAIRQMPPERIYAAHHHRSHANPGGKPDGRAETPPRRIHGRPAPGKRGARATPARCRIDAQPRRLFRIHPKGRRGTAGASMRITRDFKARKAPGSPPRRSPT